MRRSTFKQIGGYDPAIRGPEDCDLSLRFSLVAEMHHIDEPLLLYRSHTGNFSRNQLDNARQWLRLLGKLASSRPDVASEHGSLIRRNEAKQLCRLGRELLARTADRPSLEEARRALLKAIRLNPRKARAYFYALVCLVPFVQPIYARLRRLELRGRNRLAVGFGPCGDTRGRASLVWSDAVSPEPPRTSENGSASPRASRLRRSD
jgi:hypothetical protein